MARHILIVEKSVVRRRELQAKIMAILDDVIISEIADAAQAVEIFDRSTVHLVLCGLGKDDDTAVRFIGTVRANDLALILVLIHDPSVDLEPLDSTGVEYLQMPCSAKSLGTAVDNICNPVSLRKDKRYSLPGAAGSIEQGGRLYDAAVLNVSEGGVLCDFEVDRLFNSFDPVMLSVSLPFNGATVSAEKLYSVVSSLKIIERHSDFSPKIVRIGFKFVIVPEKAREVFRKLTDQLFPQG